MRILIHDFAGHAFPFQLSRELARRGHRVLHAYFADLPGPKGLFQIDSDETQLSVEALQVRKKFQYYSYLQRLRAHVEYGKLLAAKLDQLQPDVVLSGQAPTDVQYRLSKLCRQRNIRFVHWVQDLYALALETLLTRKFGSAGRYCAAPFQFLERQTFQVADEVVYITEDFAHYASDARYPARKSVVIQNWANLQQLPIGPKENSWRDEHGLHGKFVFLYSGTMGLKHDPHLLAHMAHRFRDRNEVRIVLVSQGIGRTVLEQRKQEEGLDNLLLLDFQPYGRLAEVLASADVLLANVEPESSAFCVPSKILNYFCAGRPILMSVPATNLASRLIERAGAGICCEPGDPEAFLKGAEALWRDREMSLAMGQRARRYAEQTFDIARIGDRFEAVLSPYPVAALQGALSGAQSA